MFNPNTVNNVSICPFLHPTFHRQISFFDTTELRVIQIQRHLINNSDYAKKFRLHGEKCIGFGQFDQKINSDYAIIRIMRILFCTAELAHTSTRLVIFIICILTV